MHHSLYILFTSQRFGQKREPVPPRLKQQFRQIAKGQHEMQKKYPLEKQHFDIRKTFFFRRSCVQKKKDFDKNRVFQIFRLKSPPLEGRVVVTFGAAQQKKIVWGPFLLDFLSYRSRGPSTFHFNITQPFYKKVLRRSSEQLTN